jgi:hypothetical protein
VIHRILARLPLGVLLELGELLGEGGGGDLAGDGVQYRALVEGRVIRRLEQLLEELPSRGPLLEIALAPSDGHL